MAKKKDPANATPKERLLAALSGAQKGGETFFAVQMTAPGMSAPELVLIPAVNYENKRTNYEGGYDDLLRNLANSSVRLLAWGAGETEMQAIEAARGMEV